MIGYMTIGTNDKDKAVAFYDALFEPLGARNMSPNDRITLWRVKGGQGMLGVSVPFDGDAASVGNGTMVAIPVESNEMVDQLHARALELGAADDGAPGSRTDSFYGGYFRDLDGNKLVFFHINQS